VGSLQWKQHGRYIRASQNHTHGGSVNRRRRGLGIRAQNDSYGVILEDDVEVSPLFLRLAEVGPSSL